MYFYFFQVAYLISVEHRNKFADRNLSDGKSWHTMSWTGKTKAQQGFFISPASMDRSYDGGVRISNVFSTSELWSSPVPGEQELRLQPIWANHEDTLITGPSPP